MKKIITLFSLALLSLLCGDDLSSMLSPTPRSVEINSKNSLTIPLKSTNVEIVTAKDALNITCFAAEELQKFLQQVLDTRIPVVNAPTPGKISFIVGLNAWSKASGIDTKKLTPEAFFIKRSGNRIYIAGRDGKLLNRLHGLNKNTRPESSAARTLQGGYWSQFHEHATLFGVYEFLERFAGVRFYFPHAMGTIIPRKSMVLPEFEIFDRPDQVVRHFGGIYKGLWDDVKPDKKAHPFYAYHLSKERNLQAWRNRMQTTVIPSMHGLSSYQLGRRFGGAHPEYFALRTDGKRHKDPEFAAYGPHFCYHSKAGDVISRDAIAALTGKSASSQGIKTKIWDPSNVQDGFFDIGFADGMYFCRCTKCQSVFAKGPVAVSTLMWGFLASIAGKVEKAGVPGWITAAAYAEATAVPECRIPGNMIVMLALPGPWYWEKSSPRHAYQTRLINGWYQKIGRRFSLYTYTAKYNTLCIPFVPNMSPKRFGKFYAETAKYTIGGTTEASTDRYLYNYLNAYIMGKMQWNSGNDYEKILKEHHKLMFGKAAGIMEEIYDTFENIWCGKIAGRMVNTSIGPKPAAPSENQIWREIYTPAVLKKLSARFDQAEKAAAADKKTLARVRYIRARLFTPMQKYAAEFMKKNNGADAFKIAMVSVKGKISPQKGKLLPETFWSKVPVLPLRPFKAQPGAVYPETQVQFIENEEYFFIRYRNAEPDRNVMKKAFKWPFDSKELWADNLVELFFAPVEKESRYYQIMVNSKGSVADFSITPLGGTFDTDFKWNSGADTVIADMGEYWIAEIRIRKSSMPGFDKGNFRANFVRTRPGRESCLWSSSPFLEKRYHEPANWAEFQRGCSPKAGLVKNGSFENLRSKLPEAWSLPRKASPVSSVALDKSDSVFGMNSLRLVSRGNRSGIVSSSQSLPGMKPNTRYRLSFFIKYAGLVPAGNAAGACVNINDGGNRWFPFPRLHGSSNWSYHSMEFTSHPKTGEKYIPYISCSIVFCEKGTAWFDGITLEEIK